MFNVQSFMRVVPYTGIYAILNSWNRPGSKTFGPRQSLCWCGGGRRCARKERYREKNEENDTDVIPSYTNVQSSVDSFFFSLPISLYIDMENGGGKFFFFFRRILSEGATGFSS